MKKTLFSLAALAVIGAAIFSYKGPTAPAIGSLTGPDISSPYLAVNNYKQEYRNVALLAASTTVCSVKSPGYASSTLQAFNLSIRTGTSTSATIDIGSALTAYATTTSLYVGSYSVASGAQGYVAIVPSAATTTILAPNTYINAKTNGPGVGGYTYQGSCQADFTVI